MTRIGKRKLRVPRDRNGEFSTALFERSQRNEKARVEALAEMYVQGVSTRKVKAITEHLCGVSFSASTISQLERKLDQALARFAHRRHTPTPCAMRHAPRAAASTIHYHFGAIRHPLRRAAYTICRIPT